MIGRKVNTRGQRIDGGSTRLGNSMTLKVLKVTVASSFVYTVFYAKLAPISPAVTSPHTTQLGV